MTGDDFVPEALAKYKGWQKYCNSYTKRGRVGVSIVSIPVSHICQGLGDIPVAIGLVSLCLSVLPSLHRGKLVHAITFIPIEIFWSYLAGILYMYVRSRWSRPRNILK